MKPAWYAVICLRRRMNCASVCFARHMRGESDPISSAVISTSDAGSTEGATPRKLSGKRTLSCEQSGKWHGSAHRRGHPVTGTAQSWPSQFKTATSVTGKSLRFRDRGAYTIHGIRLFDVSHGGWHEHKTNATSCISSLP